MNGFDVDFLDAVTLKLSRACEMDAGALAQASSSSFSNKCRNDLWALPLGTNTSENVPRYGSETLPNAGTFPIESCGQVGKSRFYFLHIWLGRDKMPLGLSEVAATAVQHAPQ